MVDRCLVVGEAKAEVGENEAKVGGLESWAIFSNDDLPGDLVVEGAMSVIQGVSRYVP